MGRREAIEAALAAWREAERKLASGGDGDVEALEREVDRHRAAFQRLTTEHMIDSIDRLKAAEDRRAGAVPSTPEFHDAAREEREIARDVWDVATQSDRETP